MTNEKFSLILQGWGCNFPSSIQTMQLFSSYVLKLKSDLERCLGSSVLLKMHTQTDMLSFLIKYMYIL